MNQSQYKISSRPRHIRYIFFIEHDYSYDKTFRLIIANQKLWGGRYNPIVIVKNNKISSEWLSVIKHYDPDYIFHSQKVDPEVIKYLKLFNPCGYFNLDEEPKNIISGVNSFYFLSNFQKSNHIFLTSDTWQIKSPLIEYFRLNYGLETSLLLSDVELSKGFNSTIIDEKKFSELNKLISELNPINQSHLSRKNLNTVILRTSNKVSNHNMEIVIAKDKNSIADLVYYWNRILFNLKHIVYCTIEELEILCEDNYFSKTLAAMEPRNLIHVTSESLNKSEVEEIITSKLQKTAENIKFDFFNVGSFPFEVMDANGLYEQNYGESTKIQVTNSKSDLFHLPKLSFTESVGFYPQKWAVDIDISRIGEFNQTSIHYPLTTQTRHIINDVEGRINRKRSISVIIHNQQNTSETLGIKIPNFGTLLKQIISRPIIHGELQETKYLDSGPHDDSNKLSAFIKTFNNDLHTIDHFFTDKFWVDLFETLATSQKASKDAISFADIMKLCKEVLARNAGVKLDKSGTIIGEKGETYKNEENLEIGIKHTLNELCNYRVFLKGFHLKCTRCSSQFWYHIKEISEKVNCKGCLEDFQLPIEPKFSYKLNDLIKNNIFQTIDNRDGNLTVIRTLVNLNRSSHLAFQYNPQINLYCSHNSTKPCAEIDVLCLSDGKLIIGEAKHDSKGFSLNQNKSLKSLVEVSKAIRPDKIILSCYVDSNGKLEKAKQGLIHFFNKWEYQPEIITLKLHDPSYFNLSSSRYFYH